MHGKEPEKLRRQRRNRIVNRNMNHKKRTVEFARDSVASFAVPGVWDWWNILG